MQFAIIIYAHNEACMLFSLYCKVLRNTPGQFAATLKKRDLIHLSAAKCSRVLITRINAAEWRLALLSVASLSFRNNWRKVQICRESFFGSYCLSSSIYYPAKPLGSRGQRVRCNFCEMPRTNWKLAKSSSIFNCASIQSPLSQSSRKLH